MEGYTVFLNGHSFLCERLSSSHSECAQCDKGIYVPVLLSFLLLPSTWAINLRFKRCMPICLLWSDTDNSLQHFLYVCACEQELHCLRLNASWPSGFGSSEIPALYQIENTKKTFHGVLGKLDLLLINAVIPGRGMVGVDWTARRKDSGLQGKPKKAVWCSKGERTGGMMHGGSSIQE